MGHGSRSPSLESEAWRGNGTRHGTAPDPHSPCSSLRLKEAAVWGGAAAGHGRSGSSTRAARQSWRLGSSSRPCSIFLEGGDSEIAYGSLHFPSQGGALQPPMSTIRSEGNKKRQPQRNISSDRTSENVGKLKDPSIFNGEKFRSYTQEEIFALFRRIQTSISKGRPALSRRRNPKEKQSPDPVPVGTSRQFPRRKARGDEYKETATIVDNHTSSEENKDSPHNSNASEDKPSDNLREHRPISKFVKRSPIVPRSLNKNNASEPATGQLPQLAEHEVLELQKINEMKVLELKELARRKGIKGYSKLKKGELLEVLRGLLQPSL